MHHPPEKCPRCGKESPFFDCCSVDIGVGIQEWGHSYTCPDHGEFGWDTEGKVVFREDQPDLTPEEKARIEAETRDFMRDLGLG